VFFLGASPLSFAILRPQVVFSSVFSNLFDGGEDQIALPRANVVRIPVPYCDEYVTAETRTGR
jgi:hypothetical protein